jgi:hypothetical protein
MMRLWRRNGDSSEGPPIYLWPDKDDVAGATGWERHPCRPPIYATMNMPVGKLDGQTVTSGPHPESLLGNIWHCFCGARWRVEEVERCLFDGQPTYTLTFTLDQSMTEEDFLAMQNVANGETDAVA